MVQAEELVGKLLEAVPEGYAEDWDNVGWMVGFTSQEIEKIMVAVDPSPEAIDLAVAEDCDLLITHHPLFFNKIDRLTDRDPFQKAVLKAIKSSLGVVSLHTNADSCPGGLNDIFCEYLELQETVPLIPDDDNDRAGMGRRGYYKSALSLGEIVKLVEQQIEPDCLTVVGETDKVVRQVAICTGSGGDLIGSEAVSRAELYITGDLKHHQVEEARQAGLSLIILDHYEMELVFLEFIRRLLEKQIEFPGEVDYYRRQNPYKYLVHPHISGKKEAK